jgi:hypothetical protein
MEEKMYPVEEVGARLGVRKSELVAVMEMQGWKSGKKVNETALKEALNAFLSASMGGK